MALTLPSGGEQQAAAKLAKTIEQSGSTIERVLLHDNTFSGKGMEKLLQALGANLRITELTIGLTLHPSLVVHFH